METTKLNGADPDGADTLQELITALKDAASEYRLTGATNAAIALRASLKAVSIGIDEVVGTRKAQPPAEKMLHYELDVARLLTARQRVEDEDAIVSLSTKVPKFLDDYVRTFQGRANDHRKQKRHPELTKQRIITEALSLFLAVHRLPKVLPDPEW